MDIAEFILKMFTVGFLIAGMLGMILQTIDYNGHVSVYDDMRLAIDLANAAAAAPCLAEKVGGDIRKGVIDSGNFQKAKQDFCLKLGKPFKIKISEAGGTEVFSTGFVSKPGTKLPQPLPVLIKTGENYKAGVLDVEIAAN